MCWAVPGRITEINGKRAKIVLSGVEKDISLDLIDNAAIGDYVMIHAGYAIEKVRPEDAEFTIDFFNKEGRI